MTQQNMSGATPNRGFNKKYAAQNKPIAAAEP
jgi:hypothetical protein